MKRIITLFFVILRLACLAQSKPAEYTLTVDFSPSFGIKASTLVVHKKRDSAFVELKVYKSKNQLFSDDTAKLTATAQTKLTHFLQTYQSKIGHNKRIVKRNKNLNVIIGMADGIDIDWWLIYNGKQSKRHLWSPPKESNEGKLMNMLLVLMQGNFQDDPAASYIKQLKEFFGP